MASYFDDNHAAGEDERRRRQARIGSSGLSSHTPIDSFLGLPGTPAAPSTQSRGHRLIPRSPSTGENERVELAEQTSSGDRRLFQTLRAQAVDLLTMFEMLEQSQPAAIGQIPASAEFRNNLPRITLGRGHADMDCPVCAEPLGVEGDQIARLPCKHMFHDPCLLPWLEKHNTCPMCRNELPTDDPQYERERHARRIAALPEVRADRDEPYNPMFG